MFVSSAWRSLCSAFAQVQPRQVECAARKMKLEPSLPLSAAAARVTKTSYFCQPMRSVVAAINFSNSLTASPFEGLPLGYIILIMSLHVSVVDFLRRTASERFDVPRLRT
jgi:hypothetical protein